MSKRTLVLTALLWAFLSPIFTTLAWGQLTSTPQPVVLTATKTESISVSAPAPGTVTFTLTGGVASGVGVPAWTTSWNLSQSRNSVDVCVYLTGDLTSSGPDVIPPANVYGYKDGGGSRAALTNTACGSSNGLVIRTIPISNANRKNSSQTDSVSLEIDETTPSISIAADTYSGTLNIVAQAGP